MNRLFTGYRFLFLLSLLSLPAGNSFAQGEYNNWYFGGRAGISFNTSPVSPLLNSKSHGWESGSSISDKDGNLLFYTDGDTVWNRNHVVMKNGTTSAVYSYRESAVQGTMVLPVPGSTNLYYIILGNSQEAVDRRIDTSISYAIVDMNGDAGLGEVVQKSKKLFHSPGECFAVTSHANGTDYWVAGVDAQQNRFRAVRTTAGQFVTAPVGQVVNDVALSSSWVNYSDNKFSPDGKVFVSNITENTITGNKKHRYLQLYRFDNATGALSSKVSIDIGYDTMYVLGTYEFSANSRFLYLSTLAGKKRRIVQYDMSNWNAAVINASAAIVIEKDWTDRALSSARCMQLGPDGRIYIFSDNLVSVIENPDLKGAACKVNLGGVDIGGRRAMFGGPYYPTFLMKYNRLSLGEDTVICAGDTLRLDTKAPVYARVQWSTGAVSPGITVKESGVYSVTVTLPNIILRDTIKVKVGEKFKVYLGPDTAFCGLFSHLLNAGAGAKSYKWNTGESTMEITVNQYGQYAVKVLDSNSCPAADTIIINEVKKPEVSVRQDSINCKYAYLSVTNRQAKVDYAWNNGDTGIVTRVAQKGLYWVTADNGFCTNADTIEADILPEPQADLGPDVFYCDKPVILEVHETGKYLWNTGAQSQSIVVTEPGFYSVSISRNGCQASDTIEVKECTDMKWYIPNAFSPDGNAFNPEFRIYGSNISSVKLQVYNRWGEKLYETEGPDVSWDGIYMGQPCHEGVYLYVAEISGYRRGLFVREHASGMLSLLR